MTLQWKSHEIYRTAGPIVKVGTYQGNNRDPQGNLVPSSFDQARVKRLFENVTDPIPMYLDDHNHTSVVRKLIGYAFKVGMSDDEIAHNGFVFDKDAQRKIAVDGYDEISPEIVKTVDDQGNVIDECIGALCFVQKGGIDNNEVHVMTEVFNAPDSGEQPAGVVDAVDMSESDLKTLPTDVLIEAVLKRVDARIDEVVSKMGQVKPQTTEIPQSTESVSAEVNTVGVVPPEFAQMKADLAAQKAITDKLQNEKYTALVQEIKSLGFSDPSTIVAGLNLPQKIETLSKMRASIVKEAPLAGVPKSVSAGGKGESGSNDDSLESVLADLGLDNEKYRSYFKGE